MRTIYIILFCIVLMGCGGPKPVGYGAEQAKITGVGYAVDDPSILRYPLSGKNIDKKLYYLNQPEIMMELQQYYHNSLESKQKQEAPNDYKNLQPREVSPFRQ